MGSGLLGLRGGGQFVIYVSYERRFMLENVV